MAALIAAPTTAIVATAGEFHVIHAFQNESGSAVPFGTVIRHDGWLYGSTAYTAYGSSRPDSSELAHDGGSIYRVRPDGSGFEVIKQFSPSNPGDGYMPFQGLTIVGDRLIGATMAGATAAEGTLYSMNLDGGDFRVLHRFGGPGDGTRPYAAPIAVGSVLYGMTGFGGANAGAGALATLGAGLIYSYDLDTSTYRIERSFTSPGANPFGTLTRIGEWLYGMVSDHRNTSEFGQVFRYRPADQAYQVVHRFAGGANGGYPYDTLTWDGGRYAYGTTLGFYPWHPLEPLDIAALLDEGVVFRIDLDTLDYQVLHDFSLVAGDGGKPNSAMLVAPDGYLYGIAHGSEGLGGESGGVTYGTEFGTLYRLRPDGTEFTVLHRFDSVADGLTPMRGLVWESGTIYGTTAMGGISVSLGGELVSRGSGTVWSYAVVPEPSTPLNFGGVMLIGLLGLWVRARAPGVVR